MQTKLGTRRRILRGAAAAAAVVVVVAGCGSDNDAPIAVDDGDIDVEVTELEGAVDSAVDGVVEEADSSSADLAERLRENGLESAAGIVDQIDVAELVGDGEFTFFAPSDEAFTSLTTDQMAELLTDPGQILETLRNHTLGTTRTAADLSTMDSVDTRAGLSLPITIDGDVVMVGGIGVVTTDITVGGGVVHVVDGFILPS
jgi:uncharacterized surface protein with fasciclin (FAS1) repeats